MIVVTCPKCGSKYVNKDGQRNGKQRYKCKNCGKKFTQGVYIRTEKKEKRKKKNDFREKNKPIRINIDNLLSDEVKSAEIIMPVRLDEKIEKVIENDIKEEKISIEYYKKILGKLSSDEENEIAKRLAVIKFNEIESLMTKSLFQNPHNEKLDALIMKILIDTGKKGMKILMEYINNSNQYKMTKYNLNVIGKHMSQELSISWNVIKQYLRDKINVNCVYTITRYINYISKLSYRDLRKGLDFEEIKSIYFDKQLDKIFTINKISDSDYFDNFGEYHYSLNKILEKMAKKELVNYDYLEQYYNSIFTEDNISNCLERAYFSVKNKDLYNKLEKMNVENVSEDSLKYISASPVLTQKGINILGDELSKFYDEYCNMEFNCKVIEFEKWLDKYTSYIYKNIILYGIDEFKTFFNSWEKEFVFRCKIMSKETENQAEKICKKYFDNPGSNYPDILDEVFESLLYYLNEKAIDTLIYMIDNDIVDKNSTLFHDLSFSFVIGVTEKIYGDFYNIKVDYSYRRINRGIIWENLVGYILKENSKNIEYHPTLDNNKIPDYAEIINNRIEKIQECKLILGFRELKETITKYSPYCNFIEIYCIKNEIDECIINSIEYNSLMNCVQKEFKYIIKDYNDIYDMTNRYKETLEYFAKNVKETTQKNLMKEKICIMFDGSKREKILYLLDNTFKYSGLF